MDSSHQRKYRPRVLYFHTGTWKTGSTALQAYLYSNRSYLANLGISYEFRQGADHKEGNGRYLCRELFDRQLSHATLNTILEDYLAERRVGLCSSEDFTRFRKQEWEQVIDASHRLSVQVRTITYIRDVGPYYGSLHAQLFKAGQHYCDLEEFCMQDCYRTVMDSLKCLRDLIGREAMTVIHYDSAVDKIDSPLTAALGVGPSGFDRSMLAGRSNRSLSKYEMEILGDLIKRTGEQFAPDLAIRLLERHPDVKPATSLGSDIVELLTLRHEKDISWVNEQFFGGGNVVSTCHNSMDGVDCTLSAEVKRAIDKDVVNWCISKLESAQEAGAAFIATRLAAIDWRNIGNPAIPIDFDPIAYLLLNLDVLKAGMPPCQHFITSGQHEKGRRWRWETR